VAGKNKEDLAMHNLSRIIILFLLVSLAAAQSPEHLLSDTRLSVNTLVREDLFAGFLTDDLERMARGRKNIELLLEKRPSEKSNLLAWKASAEVYLAVRAFEGNRSDDYQKKYRTAMDLFSQSQQLDPNGVGFNAIRGGTIVVFGDRLTPEDRASAWSQAYESYQVLWKDQAPMVDKLPVHLRGELLAGLATTAQRTGRVKELDLYLDKILEVMKNTPYESVAKQWKKNPETAGKNQLICLSCHDAGRLANRMSILGIK
jgi:hypothetical protein